MKKIMNIDKNEIILEAVKVIVLSTILVFVCFDATYPDVLWKSAIVILKGAIIGIAYFVGRELAYTYKEGWKNYLVLFYGVGILTVVSWVGLGTHTEDTDPLFGGGETVVDFVPTNVEQANHAVTIFLSLLVPALCGMYKKRNP
jgi:hypothetical protein